MNANESLQHLKQLVNDSKLSKYERDAYLKDIKILYQVLEEFVKDRNELQQLKQQNDAK